MTRIPYSVKIITPINKIKSDILKDIRNTLNKILPAVAKNVEADIKERIIKPVFVSSPEFEALANGPLDAHFGIPQGEALGRLDSIVDTLIDSVFVEAKKISIAGGNFRGGLVVKAIKDDFVDVLGLEAAVVEDTKRGYELPWLDWLLIRGDSIIVTDFQIEFGTFPGSRSGKAIMDKQKGALWRVPPGVSGTPRNNWFTRAIKSSQNFLSKAIEASVERHLRGKL